MTRTETLALLAEAEEAAGRAYAPYSGFSVGAVAVTESGEHFTAANVENAAFGSSMCAEAAAVAAAVGAGHRQIRALAVAAGAGGPCPPCGNCRQIMREFAVQTLVVRGEDGQVRVLDLDAVLPHAFGASGPLLTH